MFTFERQYYGERYVISADMLSKYAKKKLAISHNYGFVKIIDEFIGTDKVKVDVYYLDFCYGGFHPANFVSTEIVDKNDIKHLNWNTVKELYKSGVKYIVENYLLYLEIYNTSATGWNIFSKNKQYGIYNWPDCFNAEDAIQIYDNYDDLHTLGTEWMIEQVESGNVNIEEQINQLCKKYNMNNVFRN